VIRRYARQDASAADHGAANLCVGTQGLRTQTYIHFATGSSPLGHAITPSEVTYHHIRDTKIGHDYCLLNPDIHNTHGYVSLSTFAFETV
jgi:hypothetical protein